MRMSYRVGVPTQEDVAAQLRDPAFLADLLGSLPGVDVDVRFFSVACTRDGGRARHAIRRFLFYFIFYVFVKCNTSPLCVLLLKCMWRPKSVQDLLEQMNAPAQPAAPPKKDDKDGDKK